MIFENIKLINDLKRCKENRKKYKILPIIKFERDTKDYLFSFFPTIVWSPWVYRFPNAVGVVDIWWLHFHILIGKWTELSCMNCKHQEDCVKSKRINWYYDNIFEQEECFDFKPKY